ncbi:MAG: homocysteine S-methyltransferase family protein [Oscillospiraceae bacterium]|nr:homocysteine S-methyltransferase family protein [Oscillospiraceae bacterium]
MQKQAFQALARRGLLLDGATGSNLMRAGMPKGVSSEHWVLEHPEVLRELQRQYVEAGSQMVYAPTFTASRVYDPQEPIAALNRRLVALSREAVGDVPVAGDVTTMGRPGFSYEEMLENYREQIRALAEAGCDAIAVETMMGSDEATAALEAALELCDLPVLCTFSVASDGMLYFGGSVFEAARTLEALGASAVGVNCSSGPEQLEAVIRELRQTVSIPVVAKPNAGMPVIDETGAAIYPMREDAFAHSMEKLIVAGATVVGGCCGTTPGHIAALRRVFRT